MQIMSEYYLKCLIELLEGLECQNIPHLIENLTPEKCKILGMEIRRRTTAIIDELNQFKGQK